MVAQLSEDIALGFIADGTPCHDVPHPHFRSSFGALDALLDLFEVDVLSTICWTDSTFSCADFGRFIVGQQLQNRIASDASGS